METMENLYKGLFAQFDEDVSAANPYGCNQHGHRGGHQGGTGKAGKEGETDTKKEKDETSQLDEATRKQLNVDKEKQKIIGTRYFQYGGASQEKYAKASRFYDVLDDVVEMVRSGPGKEKLRDVPDIELKQKLMSEYLNDKDANVFKMEHNTIDVRRPSFVYDKSAAKDWVNKHRDNVINYF